MERGKSFKQSQTQALRQIIAEFDLQTHINKIAVRCFNELLQNHKQAFEYLVENDKKISQMQIRMTKAEGFASSIEANVNSKVEITNSLSRRLETFNKQFYESIKENEALVRSLRKDYDALVTSNHKNSHELRSTSDQIKKNNAKVSRMELVLQENLNKFTNQLGQNTVDLQKQLIEARDDINKLSDGLTHAKSEYLSKGSNFEEISQDMQLYKFERESTERRLNDIMRQVQVKANKADVSEMRLFFDSQITTQHENSLARFNDLTDLLKGEVKNLTNELKKMNDQSQKKWSIQNKLNLETKASIQKNRSDFQARDEELQSRIIRVQKKLEQQLNALKTTLTDTEKALEMEIEQVTHKVELNRSSISQLQSTIKTRSDEILQLTSTVESLRDHLNNIVEENDRRKKQLQKMQTEAAKSNIGNEMSNMSGALGNLTGLLDHLRDEIIDHKRMTNDMKLTLERLEKKQISTQNNLEQQEKKLKENMNAEKQENQNKFVQINRRISDVSIELMKSIQQAEAESKDYTDQLKKQLNSKFEMIAQMKLQMEVLKEAFKEQMEETQKLNRVLSEKMEKVTTTMTKFKSDITLKVEGIVNQQQRRSIEIKQITKTLEDLRRHVSNQTEGLNIALAMAISREVGQQSQIQTIKISSLIQGWILQIQEKGNKYRGDPIQRKKMLWVCLNFLSYQGDKVKGGVIQSGKDVYLRMMDEQQIFTARKRIMSKKVGSQLPKLYM